MKAGYVYIMASATRTTYIGVTSDLDRRVWEHKAHYRDGFTKQHEVTKLVYIAEFERMDDAIAWEKAVKGKTRAKKWALIKGTESAVERSGMELVRQPGESGEIVRGTAGCAVECYRSAAHGDPSLRSG